MLIDQKRAHERVLYERFLECLSNNRAISQIDMFPVTTELNPADNFILKEIEGELKLLGFSIDHSGKNTITINGRPADSDSSDTGRSFSWRKRKGGGKYGLRISDPIWESAYTG